MRRHSKLLLGAILAGITVGVAGHADAATQLYLTATGVDGGSTASGFTNFIDATDFSIAVNLTVNAGQGATGASVGTPTFSPLVIDAATDSASGTLLGDLLTNKVLSNVTLDLVKGTLVYASWQLTNAILTGYSTGATGGGDPQIKYTFGSFNKIEYKYTAQNADGTAGSSEVVVYDVDSPAVDIEGSVPDFTLATGNAPDPATGVAVANNGGSVSTPEPASMALLGAAGLLAIRRRSR